MGKEEMLANMKLVTQRLNELRTQSVQFDDAAERRAWIHVPAATTVGRRADVSEILARLSACHYNEGPTILLIQGQQGVGKATLAAEVFDDDRFKCYSRVWINLSLVHMPGFHEIGMYIISELVSAGAWGEEDNKTHRKDVLVVLHNNRWGQLHSDHEWRGLKEMLSVQGMHVIIIATTQYSYNEQAVHDMELFGVQPYGLAPLHEDMCCEIIKQAAVPSQDSPANNEDLELIAPQVAKLCGGLPMAAQLFGSVLQLKQYSEWPDQWDFGRASIQRSHVETSLWLGYRSMPPNLRLCFAYSAFVAERQIVKQDLIHQWIVLHLIEPSETFSMPQLAEQYLRKLLDMSLLQTAKSSPISAKDDTCAVSFTMHRGVRKFALDYLGAVLNVVEKKWDYHQAQNYICSYALVIDLDDTPLQSVFPVQKIMALRCLGCNKMNLGDDSFLFARCLRVLELNDESSMKELPKSICQLSHLGYLKLSGWSGLGTLPQSIGNLINLLHIDLSSCSELVSLPGSFGRLTNLVHINLSGCSKLENLPESFRKLIKLVHINLSGSSALKTLPEFFGKLLNLVRINLSGCLALVNLPESFGELTKLENINLSGCLALVNLPESFGKLTKLEHINLSDCYGLSKLPESFGEITNLAHINLSGCSALEALPQPFGKLTNLVHIDLSGCSELVTLPGSFGDLQNLLYIDLSRCYGLSKLPESFAKLKKLVHLDLSFWSCFEGIQTALGGLTSLQHLNLSHPCCYHADYNLQGLKDVLSLFIRLKHLNLSMFLNPIFCNQTEEENFAYIEFISGFSRLEHLDLSHNIFLHALPVSLYKLKKLHTVDLSGCIRLKNVPEWMTKLYSLKSVVLSNMEIYQFAVGTDNVINNYGQLVDVRCKELEITCLNKMESVEEARRIRLAQKHNLQKLKLCWSVGSQGTMEDNVLVGELVPPHSLQYLELHGYSSICFPSWLTSSRISSFNLVAITMENIPKCRDLPPLGLLPNLQSLSLRRMDSITRIDAGELSGDNTAAFSRLSRFIIQDMGSLEEFTYYSSGGGGEKEFLLPAIDELVVHNCPNLSFVPLPPRARRLVISGCNDAMVCWQNRAGRHGVQGPSCISSPVIEVTELVVDSCRVYLSHWCLLNHLPGLRSLTIKNCNNLTISPEIIGALSSLQTLCFSECNSMIMLPENLCGLTSLQELQIKSCGEFQKLPESIEHLSSLQKITIEGCVSLDHLPPSISKLTNLKDLHILDCDFLNMWSQLPPESKNLLGHIQPKIEEHDSDQSH